MKRYLLSALVLAAACGAAQAQDQPILDACIAHWGKDSPFRKGTPADSAIGTGVKVFGIGAGQSGSDPQTTRPALVYVKPAVNVAGGSTIRLNNPNGWYCFRSNVTVAGALNIEAPCNARIASAREDGTTVGAKNESGQGTAVFGVLRVTRFGCS